jgi:YHS domain-containing protein
MEDQEAPPVPKTACGGILTEPEKYPSAEYQGRRIYFCTLGCLHAFESDPERFMDGEIPHPIDE